MNTTVANKPVEKELIKKENQNFPCQYTIDEVKEGIKQSIEEAKAGKITSYEAVLKRTIQ